MAVRLFHWTAEDVYKFFNTDHPDWPNLPPPPNGKGLQVFMLACVDITIEDKNRENDPDAAKRGPQRRRI